MKAPALDHEKLADALALLYAQLGGLCDAMVNFSPKSRAVARLNALKRALGQLRRELATAAFQAGDLNAISPYAGLGARLEKLLSPSDTGIPKESAMQLSALQFTPRGLRLMPRIESLNLTS